MDYKFKKSTCERYDIKFGSWGWAIITIDENGGLFNCHSDYGDYNYSWPNHGRKSFKHFMIEVAKDSHYLLKKVAEENFFNFDKHLKIWKRELIKYRREESRWEDKYSKENIRQVWDFLCDLESDYSNSPDLVAYQIYDSYQIRELGIQEPWYAFPIDKDYSPQSLSFAREIMPIFAEILQKEIDENVKSA